MHLYRYDTEKKGEEVKSLYNITPEQFDLYGYQYVELTSAKSPTISFSKLPVPGREVDPEGRSRFACTRLKEWSTFVIQYRIFYEFHGLIDGPRPTCEYPVNE